MLLPQIIETALSPFLLRAKRTRRQLDECIYRLIEKRRKQVQSPDWAGQDLITLMLRANDVEGKRLSAQQIRDESVTLFGAGQEATASGMSWAIYCIFTHPKVLRRLQDEISQMQKTDDPVKDLMSLKYAGQVWDETLRLYPPVGRMGRRAMKDMEIAGYTIPAGSVVFISPMALHRNSKLFPDPDTFDPERWTPEEKKNRSKYAYLPYGAGSRVCIGARMSWVLGLTMIAELIPRWQLSLVPGHEVTVNRFVTQGPYPSLPMTVSEPPDA